jgi:hypothetical protein
LEISCSNPRNPRFHFSGCYAAPGDVDDATFPLILTFSLREKEQPLVVLVKLASKRAVSAVDLPENWGRFSLSLRERAGVRGNIPFELYF